MENKDLLKVAVRVGDQVFEVNGDELTKLEYSKITEALLKYPSSVAWVGSLREEVLRQLQEAEDQREELYAELDLACRRANPNAKERHIKSLILTDPQYKSLLQRIRELQYLEGKLKAILNALAKMESSLVQLSTLYKKEMDS